MNNFISLLRNEHMKIYKKLSTYIMMGILVLIVVIIGTLIKISDNSFKNKNTDEWKKDYQVQVDSFQKELSDNNLSAAKKTELQTEINYYQYCLENNIKFDTWKSEAARELQNLNVQGEAAKGTPLFEKLSEQYLKLEKSIENSDWEQYLTDKKSSLTETIKLAGDNEQAKNEYQITLDTIELRLKYNISPDDNGWKNQDVISLEENKRTLFQLESTSGKNTNLGFIERTKSTDQNIKTFKNYIKMAQYRIENNIAPTDMDGTQWEFLKDIMENLLNVIVVFVVIICSGIVAGEFSDGTIKQLLIRPYRRWEILLSKYITCFIYTIEMMVVLIASAYFVGGIFYGFTSPPTFLYMNGSEVATQDFTVRLLFESTLNLIPLVMVATLAFMISTVFKNNGLSIGLSLLLLFIGGTIVQVLAISLKFDWTKYILFANWNILYYFTEGRGPLIEGMTLGFSLTVLAVYYLVFNAVTFFTFTKRDITT